MADAAVEKPQTAGAEQDSKSTENNNTTDSKPTESTTNGNDADKDVKEGKATNGERQADEEDEHERYDTDKQKNRGNRDDRGGDRHDRSDFKRRDFNDRGRGGGRGRGGRGGNRGRGGRGGRGGWDNNRDNNNRRTRFERKEESSDATEIRRQIEFYFSDSNLPIDKFLLQETGGPENRPVPLKTIHNFKRMRHFQPFTAVVNAVKGSYVLEVNDKDEVYRKTPIASYFTKDTEENDRLLTTETMARSIYAKGFGEEHEDTAFKIEEFFEPYGVRGVRLRREKDGTFKGSVFVEFESEEAAEQFLNMEEPPKFNDTELKIMSKKEYVDEKSEGIRNGTVKPNSPTRRFSNHRDNRRGGRDNGGYNKRKRHYDDEDNDEDNDNWRERRDRFQKKRGDPDYSPYVKPESDGKNSDDKGGDEKPEEKKADGEKTEETDAPQKDTEKPEETKVEEAKVEASA
ncbi:hypothetical protein PRZ48_003439 [Zasmidium cellare]|uniref:Uncharacterized protein n=1 Tax=Zasmidium cellare TaxID=395010 RepID=A0ABR0EWL0_ZASCE|nr:hypothetical protein PRZ48_003439 [Zasmidium cellare]